VIGLYGVLVAKHGLLRLREISSVHPELTSSRAPVGVPGWFAQAYGSQQSDNQWQQANLSPNFPVVAEVLLEMYQDRIGGDLDGVLAMDPTALERFLGLTGPVEAHGETLTSDQVRDKILKDQYLRFGSDKEQEDFLAGFVDAFWDRVQAGDLSSTELPDALSWAAASGHLKAYVRDEETQRRIAALGAQGWVPEEDPNVQMVFHNNNGVNKLDVFLRRSMETTVAIQPDGSAQVTTTLSLRNRAPNDPSSLLLGTGRPVPVGTNRMVLNVMLPRGAVVESSVLGKEERTPLVYMEEGERPVVWESVTIPSGGRTKLEVRYTIPQAVRFSEDRGEHLALTLLPQSLSRPDSFSLTVVPPEGYSVASAEGFEERSGQVTVSGDLDVARTFFVHLRAR
jgi:hypothetical protein